MTEEKKELVDEILKQFKHDRELETKDFLYWIQEVYVYNGKEVGREHFIKIKDYAIKHGTLPFIKIQDKIDKIQDKTKKLDAYSLKCREERKYTDTGTHSHQRILRYSKKYDNLEMYDYDVRVRATTRNDSYRILCMPKRSKTFSINDKNYVLIYGNRWLSLKNWSGFANNVYFMTPEVVKMMMNLMLGNKDWIKDLEVESVYISNKNSRKAKSLDHAVELECGSKPPKIIKRFFKNNINDILHFYQFIEPNQIHYITNFIKRNIKNLEKILKTHSYVHDLPGGIIYLYYLTKDTRLINNKGMVKDYLRMLAQEGGKINLKISSYKNIKAKHDELSDKILKRSRDKTRLKVAKFYPKIDSIPGAVDVELIKSADRLNIESEILHHCVHSYKTNINSGLCAIYSLVHDEERYTLEVRAVKKNKESEEEEFDFVVSQLKGKYNCSPPVGMKKYIDMMCENHELKLPEGSIHFQDKVKKKENITPVIVNGEPKIEQIGEAVLDEIISKITLEDEQLPF